MICCDVERLSRYMLHAYLGGVAWLSLMLKARMINGERMRVVNAVLMLGVGMVIATPRLR